MFNLIQLPGVQNRKKLILLSQITLLMMRIGLMKKMKNFGLLILMMLGFMKSMMKMMTLTPIVMILHLMMTMNTMLHLRMSTQLLTLSLNRMSL